MQRPIAILATARRERRATGLSLLIVLLLLQVNMAFAGCALQPVRPAPDPDAVTTLPCHARDSELARHCLRHCEQTGESLTSSSDAGTTAPADIVSFAWATCARVTARTSPFAISPESIPRANGPPVYLRLARLLN